VDKFDATRRVGWSLYSDSALTTTSLATLADVVVASLPALAKECAVNQCNKAAVSTMTEFLPYGVGTAGQTIDVRVVGWSLDPTGLRYVPRTIARLTCTLSAVVLAGTSNKTCDTIEVTEGTENVDVIAKGNASGFGTFRVDTLGSEYFTFEGNRGSATSFNTFYKPI
jgi:hypothetical protein